MVFLSGSFDGPFVEPPEKVSAIMKGSKNKYVCTCIVYIHGFYQGNFLIRTSPKARGHCVSERRKCFLSDLVT